MKLIKHNEIDLSEWDKTIENSDHPLVFAQSFYLNAVCPEWKAIISNDHKTLLPVTESKKLGIKYLIQPPFTPQLGVYGNTNAKIFNECFDLLKSLYKFISIELNAGNNSFHSGKSKKTFVIDLEKDPAYNSNTKRNISKAIKSNLKVEEIPNSQILVLSKKFIDPFLKNKLKLPLKHIKIFSQLLCNAINENKLKCLVTKNENGEILAIAHFIFNSKHAVYLKGTSFEKEKGSMHLLMDTAIKIFLKKKVRNFDFGGGQIASLAQFYSGFGAQEVEYKIYFYNKLPKAISWLKKA
jgi:hypothetical protein